MFGRGLPALLTSTVFAGLHYKGLRVVVAWWVLDGPNALSDLATIVVAASVCEIAAKLLAAPIGDVLDVRRALLICSSVTLCAMVPYVLWIAMGSPQLASIAILSGLFGAMTGVREPLQACAIPNLTTPEKTTRAMELYGVCSTIVSIGGPAASGLMLQWMGIPGAAAVCAVWAAFALFLVARLPRNMDEGRVKSQGNWFSMIASGLRAIFRIKAEFYFAINASLMNLLMFPFFLVLLPFYYKTQLGAAAWQLGILDAMFAFGALATLSNKLLDGFAPQTRLIRLPLGIALLATCIAGTGISTSFVAHSILFFLGGAGLIFANSSTSSLRLLASPSHYRARIVSTVVFISSLMSPLGVVLTEWLAMHIEVRMLMIAYGAVLLSLVGLIFLNSQLVALLRRRDSDLTSAYSELYPRAFST